MTSIELREPELVFVALSAWYDLGNTPVMPLSYKETIPAVKCSVNLGLLQLGQFLRKWSRKILSKIVQYRSGHAVGSGSNNNKCSCGSLETIDHILKECLISETYRQDLRAVSAALDDWALLETEMVLIAIANFLQQCSEVR